MAATPTTASNGTRTRARTAEGPGPRIPCSRMSRAKPSMSRDFKVAATRKVPPATRAQAKTTTGRRRFTKGSFFSVELDGPVDRLAREAGDETLERVDRQRLVDEQEVLVE